MNSNPSATTAIDTRNLNPVSLSHLGVISARGPDAGSFLQGQLTNDVLALDSSRAIWAGYCSAKGRLLATFLVWRPEAEVFHLMCPREILAPTLKRLSMFVLRAKCKLQDDTDQLAIQGVWGAALPGDLSSAAPMTRHGEWIRLSDVQDELGAGWVARAVHIAEGSSNAPTLASSAWSWLEVTSGAPAITPTTTDAFVPQMVNLELIGGVSFRKGCYPGQEVVARSQYRGTLKRRMHLFMGRDDVVPMATPGAEVFHPSDPTQPCGTVVNVAHHDGQIAALISLKSAVLDADDRRRSSVHLGSVDGPALNWHPLPYAVPDEASDPV